MARRIYLETLADEELSNCVKFLSEKPHSNWYENMRLENRYLAFNKFGPFARVIPYHVTRIALNRAITLDNLVTFRAEDLLLGSGILREWGNSVLEMHIDGWQISESKFLDTSTLIRGVQTQCNFIHRLALRFDSGSIDLLESLLGSKAAQLESLRLWYGPLGFLKLNLPTFPGLKSLHVDGLRVEQFSCVIQSSCKTLECVALNGPNTDWMSVIADLSGCSNLRDVELHEGVPSEEHATLLESLGPKLERACLHELDEDHCERVVNSCPNMECSLLLGNADDLRKILIVGLHLRQLNLRYDAGYEEFSDMEAAVSNCWNMRTLYCTARGGRGEPLIRLFKCKKNKLESIRLFLSHFSSTNELIRSIGLGTGNLRTLVLSTNLIDNFSELLQLLDANQQLEEVSIGEKRKIRENIGIMKVLNVTRCMKQHRKLCKLSVSFQMRVSKRGASAIVTECVPFRNRRVVVDVNGKMYCGW